MSPLKSNYPSALLIIGYSFSEKKIRFYKDIILMRQVIQVLMKIIFCIKLM
jgi:hypothetical protein